MQEKQPSREKKDIRNIILVLFSAIAFAVGLSAFMILKYGPTGHYWVSNALLDPTVAKQMDYYDPSAIKGKPPRYVLDKFEFSYFDQATKSLKKLPVDMPKYENFYALIIKDKSIQENLQDVASHFNDPDTATLTITVRNGGSSASQEQPKIFQRVQFSQKEGYYRIRLHQQSPVDDWIYFQHPGIYESVMKLFTTSSDIR